MNTIAVILFIILLAGLLVKDYSNRLDMARDEIFQQRMMNEALKLKIYAYETENKQ